MAKRKSSGSGIVIVGLIILALFAKYWVVVVSSGVAALVIWIIAKVISAQTQTQANGGSNPSLTTAESTRPKEILVPVGESNTAIKQSGSLSKQAVSGLCPQCLGVLAPKIKDDLNYLKCAKCAQVFPAPTQHQPSSSPPLQQTRVARSIFDGSEQQSKSASPDDFWVPYGRTIHHSGYSLSGGLIYFGSGLRSIRRWNEEPSLLDPNLPIDKAQPDREGANMTYWPSYSQIHPASRAAFLEWLSNGRNDPKANIGYVFLYFYGLERRALADAKDTASARDDVPTIIAEVKRLLSIYRDNGSFFGYASEFLDILQVSQTTGPIYRTPPQIERCFYKVPLALKLALGQMATDNVPLPAEWALTWAENDPAMPRRMAAQRCAEEFRNLFRIRYNDKFGEGLKLKSNKARIQAIYRPASSSFGGQVEISIPDLPDLTQITGPSSKIADLVVACTDELEGYSRFLGRNPDGKNSIEATSYLPQPLLERHAGNEFRMLSSWLNSTITSDESFTVSFSSLLQHVPSINRDEFGKKEATAIANLLGKMRIGIEPDPRFGTFLPKPDQIVVLFKISDKAPNAPSPEYSAATVVLHLASAVAGADGTIEPDEERHLEKHIETWLHLTADENTRLKAHTEWLLSSCPGMNGVKKRIEMLKQDQRESLGRFLVGVAQADGYIDPTEMKTLTKIYNVLNLDTQILYSHAHAAAIEPVTVQTKDFVNPQGYTIPSPLLKPSEGISLDMSTVEAKLAETVAVSAILNDIFTEKEPVSTQEPVPEPTTAKVTIVGLDNESYVFMQVLASKLMWDREELEKLASAHCLMLDGTLDSINDASFDHFGGPFFEGDDPIEINAEFAKEIDS